MVPRELASIIYCKVNVHVCVCVCVCVMVYPVTKSLFVFLSQLVVLGSAKEFE